MKSWLVVGLALSCVGGVAPAATPVSAPMNAAAGEQLRECNACPEMIVVPAGSFTIGSPPEEAGRRNDEGPQRVIRVGRPFAVGRYEITRRQYEAFLRDSKHEVSGGCVTDRRNPGQWAADAQTNFHDPGFAQTPDHPAACVSWNDAAAYVGWLNSKTAGGYRLLTEAEWEYVARAGSTAAYPWGPSIHDGCAHMNGYDKNILARKGDLYREEEVPFANCSDGYLNTAPVGSFKANAFGVHDMIGNLAEWVEDCATESYAVMQVDGVSTGGDCGKRMVRGGSWGTQPRQLRSAERIRYKPTDLDDSIGIRVAKTLAATPSADASSEP